LNLSTGKAIQSIQIRPISNPPPVQSFALHSTENLLFVADANGFVHIFEFNNKMLLTVCLRTVDVVSAGGGVRSGSGSAITSLSLKAWQNHRDHSPELIMNVHDNSLKVFLMVKDQQTGGGVIENADGTLPALRLKFERRFECLNSKENIRSCFCPLISMRDGACVVSGTEDMKVRIFDVKRGKCVNELMGHSGPVLDVSWNYDESLLASCDTRGVVILWKRILINRENPAEMYRS